MPSDQLDRHALWQKKTWKRLIVLGITGAIFSYVFDVTSWLIIVAVVVLGAGIASVGNYVQTLAENVSCIAQALAACGVLKIEESKKYQYNWMYRELPPRIVEGGGLTNVVHALRPPSPLLAAYTCHIAFMSPFEGNNGILGLSTSEQLFGFLGLDKSERNYATHWRAREFTITWQKWSGGFERWLVQITYGNLWHPKTSQLEYTRFADQDYCPGTVWIGPLGAQDEREFPRVELAILPKEIRLSAKFGRFEYQGIEGEVLNLGLGQEAYRPKPEWLLVSIPTTESGLSEYEEPREELKHSLWWMIDQLHGLPPQWYFHEDHPKGIVWGMTYRGELRTLWYGTVLKCTSFSSPGYGEGKYVVLSLASQHKTYGHERPYGFAADSSIEVRQSFLNESWVEEGDAVYAVFACNGQIERLWPAQEIERLTMGRKRESSLKYPP